MKTNNTTLAVDTSGRLGSVALSNAENEVFTYTFSGPMRHTAELFPAIKDVMQRAKADEKSIRQVCISAGPGSFTGLRIAVSLAKMMALSNQTRIIAVNSLDAAAQNADRAQQEIGEKISRIGVILDAKRKQFFAGVYKKQQENWTPIETNLLVSAEDFLTRFASPDSGPIHLLGEGLLYYKDTFKKGNVHILNPEYWPCRAENVLKIGLEMAQNGEFSDPATLTPIYIQKPDAVEKTNRP